MQEGRERRGRLRAHHRHRARAQRGVGREGGALVGLGHRARGGEAQGRGPGGRQRARSPRQDRRPDGQDGAGPVTLATKDAPVKAIEVRFRDRFLALITDPNIAYILMMVGHAGHLLRAVEPGRDPARRHRRHLPDPGLLRLPEPADQLGRPAAASCSAWCCSIAEIKVVSHGVLAIGGVVAMLLGSLMLYDAPERPGIRRVVVRDHPHGGRDRRRWSSSRCPWACARCTGPR